MSKRRNRRLRETRNELLQAMMPVPIPNGEALTLDSVPTDVRRAVHYVAAILEKYGCESERATDAAWAHVCWAARVAGVWPSVVAEAHGIQV